MPTLFDETWQDNAGDTVSASDLNSHAAEHADSLITVKGDGTDVAGVGRDQPIDFTGSGVSVSEDTTNEKIVVDVTDTDSRVETQAGGTTQYADTSAINFDTSSDIAVTDDGSGQITVAASGGGGSVDDSGNVLGGTAQTDDRSIAVGAGADSSAGFDAIAVGDSAVAGDGSDVIIGSGADGSTGGGENVVVGFESSATDSQAVSIGSGSTSKARSVTIGSFNETTQNAGINISPYGGSTSALQATAIGDRGFSGVSVATDNVARIGTHQLVYGANSGGTIADTDLNNQELTIQANSAEDALTLRYKTSDGTVKTGTVNIS